MHLHSVKANIPRILKEVLGESFWNIIFNIKPFLLFSPLYFSNCLLGSSSRQTAQDLHIRRALQDMPKCPGGQLGTTMCLSLPMVRIRLWVPGFYDCSGTLPSFYSHIVLWIFHFMQNTCPAENKSTFSVFLALVAKRWVQVFQILDTRVLIYTSLLAVGLICKLISL